MTSLLQFPEGLRGIPGPGRRFPVGNALDFMLRPPWAIAQEFADRYGAISLAWLGPMPVVMLSDPDAITRVLVEGDARGEVYKGEPVDALAPASPPNTSTFVLNGAAHTRLRQVGMSSHPAYGTALNEATARVVQFSMDAARHELSAHGQGFERRVHRFMFDVVSILTAGEVLGESAFDDATNVFNTLDFRMRTNLPLVSPDFYFARRRWWAVFQERVQRHREGNGKGGLLGHLMAGTKVSLDQFAISLSNVFPGGFFSTTSALVNALVSLSRTPQVAHELRAAIDADRARGGTLDHARLAAIEPLDRVIRETLRLYTPVPLFMRRVGRGGLTLKEHRLEPQTIVAICPGPIHGSKVRWQSPEKFMPSRWTKELIAERPYGSDWYFPFGRGKRECEGRELALTLLRAVLYGLLSVSHPKFDGTGPAEQRFFFAVMTPHEVAGGLHPRMA